MQIITDILFYFPELFLLCSTFFILIFIIISTLVSRKKASSYAKLESFRTVYYFTVFILVFYLFFLFFQFSNYQGPVFLFNYSLVVTQFSILFKILVTIFSVGFGYVSFEYFSAVKFFRSEVYVIILFLVFGIVTALDSADFITFYLGLELQSICFYIFIAFDRSSKSVQSTLIYFVYSILSSAILLFGVSLVYYSAGSTNFYDVSLLNIANCYSFDSTYTFFSRMAGFIIIFAFFFKIGSFPFQFWVPEVYDLGDFFPISFLGTVSKLFGFGVFFKLSSFLFFFSTPTLIYVLQISAPISIAYGVIGGLVQTNIRRLLGFSSIAHTGYIMLILSAGTIESFVYAVFYLIGYVLSVSSLFIFFLSVFGSEVSNPLRDSAKPLSKIQSLAGLGMIKEFRVASFLLSINLFSFAGIPPFAGFFIKLFVFYGLLAEQSFGLLATAVVFGLLSSYYYISIIKNIYFINSNTFSYTVVSPAGLVIFYFLSFVNIFFLFFVNTFFKISLNIVTSLVFYS